MSGGASAIARGMPLHRLFRDSHVGLAEVHPASGLVLSANDAFAAMVGRTVEQIVGLPMIEFTVPADRLQALLAFRRAVTDRRTGVDLEKRLLRADGQESWARISLDRLHDDAGDLASIVAVLLDIDARRRAEDRLRSSEQRLQHAVRATQLGLWELDLATGRLDCSSVTCRIVGLDESALAADPDGFRRCIHPDDVEALWELDDATRHGRPFDAEYRIRLPGGTERWVANKAQPLLDAQGRAVRMIGTLADITARRQPEQELRDGRDLLEARVRERTDALAEANRTLVNEAAERRAAEAHARELMAQLVMAEEEERRRLSREIHDTLGQHVAALGMGLMSMARGSDVPDGLRRGLLQLRQSTLTMEREIDRLSHELRPAALDDLGLADALRLHAETWSRTTGIPVDLVVHGARQRLPSTIESTIFRVVQEALTNIHKHASAKRVGIILEGTPDEARAIVEDDGCGFEHPVGGLSFLDGERLGLRGMAERARMVGGRLEIETSTGNGATLYLNIPLHPPDPAGDV